MMHNLDGDAVESVAELARQAAAHKVEGTFTEIGGVPRGTVALQDLRLKLSEPTALKVSTLSAFAGYVNANKDKISLEDAIVHVVDESLVRLRGPLVGDFEQRFNYIEAVAPNRLAAAKEFAFGKWMSHMDMILALQTLFVTDSTRALLDLIKAIKVTSAVESRDGGTSQAVQVNKGIELVENVNIPNPVTLAPFRTFSEIEQPTSPFVLRVRASNPGTEAQKLELALFEADGGAWKETAVQSIVGFLYTVLNPDVTPTITIIG